MGTTGGAEAAAEAEASYAALVKAKPSSPALAPPAQEPITYIEDEEEEGEEAGGDFDPAEDVDFAENGPRAAAAAVAPASFGTKVDEEEPDGDFFRPAPALDKYEWEDSREGMRRRPNRREDDDSEDNVALR
jgi:hypothetical protein